MAIVAAPAIFLLISRNQADDIATAILKKKKKPNSLIVTDAVNDDNSVLAPHSYLSVV